MKKGIRLVFVIIIFLFVPYLHGAVYNRHIEWAKNRSQIINNREILHFHFEQAVYFDLDTYFPYYSELFEISNQFDEFNVVLEEKVYEILDNFSIADISNLNELPEQILPTINKKISRGIPYLEIYFVPIIKNPANGRVQRLTGFTIKIEKSGTVKSEKRLKSIKAESTQSVLSSAKWVKIKVSETGIHQITYNGLVEMGFSNPGNIKLFGNGGRNR